MEKPRKSPLLPIVILAVGLGAAAGFFLSLSLRPQAVSVGLQSPFAAENVKDLSGGRAFAGAAEIKKLPAPARETYLKSAKLAATGEGALALAELAPLRRDHPDFCLGHGLAAHIHIGHMDVSQADSAFAAEALKDCLDRDPEHPWANYLAGRHWEKSRRPDSALSRYSAAVKASPRFAYPYVGLGRLHLQKDEIRLAKSNLRIAIGLMEADSGEYRPREGAIPSADGGLPATESLPYDHLAYLFYRNGAEDSARMALEYGEQMGVASERMSFVRAGLWEASGFLGKADSAYRVLLAGDSANTEYAAAIATLGWKPRSRGEGGAPGPDAEAAFAISLLDPLAREHIRNGPLWMALGQAYFRRGLYGMATECFDSSLKYDPVRPGLSEKRDAAYQALIGQSARPDLAARRAQPADYASDDQASVVIPGSIALLGAYSVSWGYTQNQVRQTYPRKDFRTLPNGNMSEAFAHEGVRNEHLLAFKAGRLWGVRVILTDTAGVAGDLFGRTIRTKAKISGEGKGTGEAKCPGYRAFQGAIWENDDTFEFMAQFEGETNKVRLARVGREYLPRNRRLCDLVEYLREDSWK